MRILLVVLVVAACSDLDRIQPGVCGNGAIEEGEDCDSPDANQCVACELRCAATATPCPNGYACAPDGFCRAPSGVFYPATSAPFPVTDYAVGDVNHDGAGDVIGLTPTSIRVMEGDPTRVRPGLPTSLYAVQSSMLTPFGRGDPIFGDFDNDQRVDVLLPTADGLAGFSSQHHTLAPHAFAFNPAGADAAPDNVFPMLVFSFDPAWVSFLFGSPNQAGLALGLLDVDSGDTGPGPFNLPACAAIVPTHGMTFDTYLVSSGLATVAMIAVRDEQNHVCAFRVTIPGAGANPFAVTTLYEASLPNGTRPVFIDLDGAGCPSLVVGVGKELRAAQTSPCALQTALTNLPATITTPAVGRVPITSPLQNAAPEALITANGVFAVTTTRTLATPLYGSDRPLDVSSYGDLDDDGNLDAILGSSTSTGIDVLFGSATGTFLLYRIAGSGFVTNLASGDYDGNGVDDIVYVERTDGERLLVSYGTRDRPLPPVENGRFSNITSFLPAQLRDSVDPLKVVMDLAVVDEPAPGQLLLTILHGSPQRTLVSYFDPRGGGGGNFSLTSAFYGAVVGQFSSALDSATLPDVVAIEWSRQHDIARLYTNIGIGNGALSQSFEPSTTQPAPIWFNIANVAQGTKCTDSTFCVDRARYIALPRTPNDLVIGVDRTGKPTAISIDPAKLVPTKDENNVQLPNTPLTLAGLGAATGQLVSLRTADVDGDALADLLVAYAAADGSAGEIRVCLDDNFTSCANLAELAGATGASCVDVAAARVQARGRFDEPVTGAPAEPAPLVALCDEGNVRSVYRVVRIGDAYVPTRLFGVARGAEKIEVGDVNGDGLDDILVLERGDDTLVPTLHTFLQCSSRDVECRKANAEAR